MRMLVLGGSGLLSREVAREGLARGHEVICASRGRSGPVPEGAEHVVLDRLVDTDPTAGPWADLADRDIETVLDVASTPSWVRTALFALGVGPHWAYVSSISAYADLSVPGGTTEDTPLFEAADRDLDNREGAEAYGRNKVACEEAVREATGGRALIARAGLLAGPHDDSGRFTYWPVRLARGGPVLVPAPPEAPVQVIDARDLAAWLVDGLADGLSGTFDAVAPSVPWSRLLAEVAEGVHADPELVWVDPARLTQLEVTPWAGPRSLPLWLPEEYRGMADRDVTATLGTGLATRPISETAADVLAWVRATPDAPVTGLTQEEEIEVIARLG